MLEVLFLHDVITIELSYYLERARGEYNNTLDVREMFNIFTIPNDLFRKAGFESNTLWLLTQISTDFYAHAGCNIPSARIKSECCSFYSSGE